MHVLDEVDVRVVVVDHVEDWFLLLIKEGFMHLNGGVILEATNIHHFVYLGPLRCFFCI
jgi:hypothetical protein